MYLRKDWPVFRMDKLLDVALMDADGMALDDDVVVAAFHGSPADFGAVRFSVNRMIVNGCGYDLAKIYAEYDLERHYWSTDRCAKSARHADQVMSDWLAFGSPTLESLHDVVSCVVSEIRAVGSRMRGRRYVEGSMVCDGGVVGPKEIWPPQKAPDYVSGDGFSSAPDMVAHPLTLHLASGEPCGLDSRIGRFGQIDGFLPHSDSGCAKQFRSYVLEDRPVGIVERQYGRQRGKESMIEKMVGGCDYGAVLESGGTHHVLVETDDVASMVLQSDTIRDASRTPVYCLAANRQTIGALLGDDSGNDARWIAGRGRTISGNRGTVDGECAPPRPATFSDKMMLYNMERYGFELMGGPPKLAEADVRVEYVIAGAFFSLEPRWYITGAAVMLRRQDISWPLMIYLARMYGFGGSLYGILDSLARQGQARLDYPLNLFSSLGTELLPTEDDTISEAMRVYGSDRGPCFKPEWRGPRFS